MKIGIILTGYNMEEYVSRCLGPWIQAKKIKLDGHEFVICGVSVPFAGFPASKKDNTTTILEQLRQAGAINHLITEPENIPETTARGMALQWLKTQEVDIIWQVDLDELYTINDISNILACVDRNPFITWFRLSLKNYVLDEHTFLEEPFQPPRIHRINDRGYSAHSFSADNDIQYGGKITRDIHPQEHFATMIIPQGVAWVRHMTWQNNSRSRRKIEYQLKGRNWPSCTFAWDDARGGLIFNPFLPAPKIARD